jgi:hypothetical protein
LHAELYTKLFSFAQELAPLLQNGSSSRPPVNVAASKVYKVRDSVLHAFDVNVFMADGITLMKASGPPTCDQCDESTSRGHIVSVHCIHKSKPKLEMSSDRLQVCVDSMTTLDVVPSLASSRDYRGWLYEVRCSLYIFCSA